MLFWLVEEGSKLLIQYDIGRKEFMEHTSEPNKITISSFDFPFLLVRYYFKCPKTGFSDSKKPSYAFSLRSVLNHLYALTYILGN